MLYQSYVQSPELPQRERGETIFTSVKICLDCSILYASAQISETLKIVLLFSAYNAKA